MVFIENIKNAWKDDDVADSAKIVEIVLLIAGFAVVAVLATTWIGNAVAGQAQVTAHVCISDVQAITGGDTNKLSKVNMEKCQGLRGNDIAKTQAKEIEDTKGGRF